MIKTQKARSHHPDELANHRRLQLGKMSPMAKDVGSKHGIAEDSYSDSMEGSAKLVSLRLSFPQLVVLLALIA